MTMSYPCYESVPLHPELPGMPAFLNGYNCTDGTLLIQGLAPRNVVTVTSSVIPDGEFDMSAHVPILQAESLLRASSVAEAIGQNVDWTGDAHRQMLFSFIPFATCYPDGRIDLTEQRSYRTQQWFLHRDDLQAIYDNRDNRPQWWKDLIARNW